DWMGEALQAYQSIPHADANFELYCYELGYCLGSDEHTREQNFNNFMNILTTKAAWEIDIGQTYGVSKLELTMCCRLPLSIEQYKKMCRTLLNFILNPDKSYEGKCIILDTINIVFRQLPTDTSKEIIRYLQEDLFSQLNFLPYILELLT